MTRNGDLYDRSDESDGGVRLDKPGRRNRRVARAARGARLRVGAAVTILAVWGVTTLADVALKGYNPPEGVNTIALAAVTYLFGSAFMKENRNEP